MADEYMEGVLEVLKSISTAPGKIASGTKVIEDGYIDSMSVFHIIADIEVRFGIVIGVMDATVEDFATPESIVSLIQRVRENG